jgi:predicted AAA+ superfamily ATPase
MATSTLYPRFAEPRLTEALADSPAVLIHGPRQCGKTTLVQGVGKRAGYTYLTFDDEVSRGVATADPVGFVADLPRRVILDEVQHVPHLFAALKTAIDRERVPERFLLTGSANVLLLPRLADSLAGRRLANRARPRPRARHAHGRAGALRRGGPGAAPARGARPPQPGAAR